MIQRALAGNIKIEEEVVLHRLGTKKQGRMDHQAIELPILNLALVEVHQELANTRRTAKDMDYNSKKTRKGAELSLKQWQ